MTRLDVLNHLFGYGFVVQGPINLIIQCRIIEAIPDLDVDHDVLHFLPLFGIEANKSTQTQVANVDGGIFDLYEIVPGFISAMLVGILVSLFVKANENEGEKIYLHLNSAD